MHQNKNIDRYHQSRHPQSKVTLPLQSLTALRTPGSSRATKTTTNGRRLFRVFIDNLADRV